MASGFNGTLYVGVTSDLAGRIAQHRSETFDGFTKRYDVKNLVWFDPAPTMADAIAHEKRIKRWRRDFKKNLIERDNPNWRDLAVALGFEPLRWNSRGPRHKAGVTDLRYLKAIIVRHPQGRPPAFALRRRTSRPRGGRP